MFKTEPGLQGLGGYLALCHGIQSLWWFNFFNLPLAIVHCVTMATTENTLREIIRELKYQSALCESLFSSTEHIDQCRGTVLEQYQLQSLIIQYGTVNMMRQDPKTFWAELIVWCCLQF